MWNQIVEEEFQKASDLFIPCKEKKCSEEDRGFIRSLLSFNKELNVVQNALDILQRSSERYMSTDEYQQLSSCFFSHDPKRQHEKMICLQRAVSLIQSDTKKYEELRILFGITNQILLLIWRVGRALMQDGEHSWSYQVIFLLLSLESNLVEGWMAYGYVNQKLHSFHTALNSYLIARILSGGLKSELDLMIADCYIDIGDIEEAISYLEQYKKNDAIEKRAHEGALALVERRVQLSRRH